MSDSVAPLNRIDDEKLAELEALEAGATPAPWEHVKNDLPFLFKDEVIAPCGCCGHIAGEVAGWDARFIAALRNAAPLLLAEVKAQRQENERLRTERDDWKSQYMLAIEVGQGKLNAVRGLHHPQTVGNLHTDMLVRSVCAHCRVAWPCMTGAALGTADQPPKGASEDA